MRPPANTPTGGGGRWHRLHLGGASVVAVYLVGAWAMFLRLGIADRTHLPTCACGDLVNQLWFLALDHALIVHGHFSLFTSLINYPSGINLVNNPGFPLLGAIMVPVTSLLGPVAAFALLVRLGFFLSALTCYLALRRVVHHNLAAAAGGLLYGFSPYMAHQGGVHMFLVFVPLPPLIFLVLHTRLSGPSAGSAFRGGLIIGVLAVAEFLISSEVLVSTVLVAVLTMAVLGIRQLVHRQEVGPPARAMMRLVGGAALVAVPVLAYPAWYSVAGPQHGGGPTQSVTSPGIDALSTLLPARGQLLAGVLPVWHVPAMPALGNTAFIGVPLLIVLGFVVATGWHLAVVRSAAVLGAVSWVLALGPRLVVHNHATSIPLPFALLTRVPLFQDLIPSRLTLYVDLAAAVLLAVGVDRLLAQVGVWSRGRTLAWVVAIAGCVALAMPVVPYPAAGIGQAGSFAAGGVLSRVANGGVVLAYPYPVYPEDQAMLWQAVGGMRFSLLGGYVLTPLGGGTGQTKVPGLLSPTAVPTLLLNAWPETQVVGTTGTSLTAAREQLPAFVRRYHLTAVIVELAGQDPGQVVTLFTSVYGPPVRDGRLDVWTNLRVPLPATSAQIKQTGHDT